METKTDSKTFINDGKTQEGIEFNNSQRQDNGDNKKSNLSVETRINEDQSSITTRIGDPSPAEKSNSAPTKSPVSLSFSIERMLNLNKTSKLIKEENRRTLTSESRETADISNEPTTKKMNLKTDSDFVRKDDNERDDDCDSNDEDDGLRVEEEGYFDRQKHAIYPNSNYFTHREDMPPNDLLPFEINSRPMWPSFFSYLGPQWSDTSRDRYGLIRRVGHPYQNRTPPKRKKPRTAFTRQQVMELEKRFSRQKYLASAERSSLAKGLNMSDSQVKTWFQNRRTKWRRQTAEEREMERQAAKKFLLSIQRDESQALYSPLCATRSRDQFHPSLSHNIDVRYIDQN